MKTHVLWNQIFESKNIDDNNCCEGNNEAFDEGEEEEDALLICLTVEIFNRRTHLTEMQQGESISWTVAGLTSVLNFHSASPKLGLGYMVYNITQWVMINMVGCQEEDIVHNHFTLNKW